MGALAPDGWWRLGESSGSALDATAGHHDGSYLNFTSGQRNVAGAIANDTDGAIAISGAGTSLTCADGNFGNFVQVPDNDLWSLTKAYDHFNRAGSNGWGAASPGYTWAPEVTTTASYYSTDGAHAVVNETTAATWEMGLPAVVRADSDSQVSASWSKAASDAQITPVALVARRTSESNYYRAELRNNTDGTLNLRITRFVGGVSANVGNGPVTLTAPGGGNAIYANGDTYYVRFQLAGTTLKAKAWHSTDTEPGWQVTGSDGSLASGEVAIRTANAGADTRVVSFDNFREQSVGMTVHLFMKPSTLSFTTNSYGYVHFAGKGESSTEDEWGYRFYPSSASPPNRLSGYIWNLAGGLGAGAHWDPGTSDPIAANTWYQIVVVYDPGDELDPTAGVSLYKNAKCMQGTQATCPTGSATLYTSYSIVPENGAAPIRIGTRDCHQFFTGSLDEMAVFDRQLAGTEISNLYASSQP